MLRPVRARSGTGLGPTRRLAGPTGSLIGPRRIRRGAPSGASSFSVRTPRRTRREFPSGVVASRLAVVSTGPLGLSRLPSFGVSFFPRGAGLGLTRGHSRISRARLSSWNRERGRYGPSGRRRSAARSRVSGVTTNTSKGVSTNPSVLRACTRRRGSRFLPCPRERSRSRARWRIFLKDRNFAGGPRLNRGPGCYVAVARLPTRLESVSSITLSPVSRRLTRSTRAARGGLWLRRWRLALRFFDRCHVHRRSWA